MESYNQVLQHFNSFTQKNDIILRTIQAVAPIPLDAEIRQTIMKSLLETPIGPNENVMSLVTSYYESLREWEEKLQKVVGQISQVQA